VASILERSIEDVDIDVASCVHSLHALLTTVEQRANCKIYVVSHEALLHGLVKTSERYCIAAVCSFVFNGDPHHKQSIWHVVVCEITADGKLLLLHNPDKTDCRDSLQQFGAIENLFFVKANT
jgi:hypothetical protein